MYPGALNTFIPTAEAALQSNFSQNPSRFKLNQYVTVAKVDKPSFYATIHDVDEEARQVFSDGRDLQWVDGTQSQENFAKGHDFTQYTCKRYARHFNIGDQAANTASWNVITDHANSAASSLMVNRSQQVLTLATTTGNWGSNYTAAGSLSGVTGSGKWDAGTATNPNIQIAIQTAIQTIEKGTNGAVTADDLLVVISPTTALGASKSAEIRSYLGNSPVALDYISGGNPNFAYGLPSRVYGVKLVVENAVKVTNAKGASRSASYILGANALILARPGALVGELNTMSTLTLGVYEDMSVILEHDNFNLLTKGKVYDNYVPILRNLSGYLVTGVM